MREDDYIAKELERMSYEEPDHEHDGSEDWIDHMGEYGNDFDEEDYGK